MNNFSDIFFSYFFFIESNGPFSSIYTRVMLTSTSGALIKDIKKGNFYIEKSIFYILKKMIAQVPMILYITILNSLTSAPGFLRNDHFKSPF
jgi:hypothetical protein